MVSYHHSEVFFKLLGHKSTKWSDASVLHRSVMQHLLADTTFLPNSFDGDCKLVHKDDLFGELLVVQELIIDQ